MKDTEMGITHCAIHMYENIKENYSFPDNWQKIALQLQWFVSGKRHISRPLKFLTIRSVIIFPYGQ